MCELSNIYYVLIPGKNCFVSLNDIETLLEVI